MTNGLDEPQQITGRVKWFDPTKGFGFIVSDTGGPDILLHANVLRNFGQGSIADDARITVLTQQTQRGAQAVEVLEILPSESDDLAQMEEFGDADAALVASMPMEPARVKWFDKLKGFGFANVFGRPEDVFIHIEVLRRSGFADLQPGEAISLRVIDGERGCMAGQVLSWEQATRSRG